ncbi:penicillin amidase [Pseudoxanthomonas sp. GM95]|uniref:penicillin acylase family protein n=1 Tax=Pseudoxanthomonas sp. GM95 TaxID=1881043 RepID=UPI0008C7E994|nr:penicillin acylase family protein [Pseudoxanthomonas sp. GM95]SEL80950.1 penicillin amidase [Pseudoxanthomonas sp. GM95]
MTRWITWTLLTLLGLTVLAGLLGWALLRGSLPALDGPQDLPGLSAPVTLSRDALGTVTIEAANPDDAARALGYVHAQERFFEMDLMRRTSAGELAALFGARALPLDRQHRLHRMRARAEADLAVFAGPHRAELDAYTAGVNDGLAALKTRPWPYLLLRQTPQPWTAADAVLTGDAMYFDLQDADDQRGLGLWQLKQHLPAPLFALLTADGNSWDAPLQGQARAAPALPDAAQVDLRKLPMPAHQSSSGAEGLAPGSNNFAVAGTLTADGRAIVADDMHLALRAPNLWFRVRLRYSDPQAAGGKVDVTGFSLPGLPAVIVGSNTHVAWGFTNGYADTANLFRVTPCTAQRTSGCAVLTVHHERIAVAGGDDETLDVRETAEGPLVKALPDGQALALRWVGHLPGALNLGLSDLARAGNLDAALKAADTIAVPAQNLMLADASGRIAWRLLGPLPQRAPGCGPERLVLPSASAALDDAGQPAAACAPWPISTTQVAALTDPADGRLWTANNRVADGPLLATLGDGGYALGARAQQIRDDLQRLDRLDERALLAVQLDSRAVFLQRWWALLQAQANAAPEGSALRELGGAAAHWDGNANIESVSFRLVRAWRLAVQARLEDGLTAPARAALGPDFVAPGLPQFEGVMWALLQQRPANLLPRQDACPTPATSTCNDAQGWDRLLEAAAAQVRDELSEDAPLDSRTWGEHNTAKICHPLSAVLPWRAKRLLCMPADPLPGAGDMPRVQAPSFGASERMVVSPGHEADGIIHMPGGQSGHPLSPYWGAGHQDWVHGRPTPFLPGQAQHTLTLQPH